jgi:tetratricopeptide (TPR) repeat protein
MGRTALALGKHADAVHWLRELHAREPNNQEAQYLYAMTLITIRQNLELAHRMLDQLVRDGGRAPAYYGRALANHALNRKAEALADIENAIRLAPNNPVLREWQAKIRAMP